MNSVYTYGAYTYAAVASCVTCCKRGAQWTLAAVEQIRKANRAVDVQTPIPTEKAVFVMENLETDETAGKADSVWDATQAQKKED